MILKLILLGVVIYVVYILFFREGNLIDKMKAKQKDLQKNAEDTVDTVVECHKCGVYVSIDEAIIKDREYYCSKECADIK